MGAGGGSMKKAFILTERKNKGEFRKKQTGLKTQHGRYPSSGQGTVLDSGKMSTKQQG